MLAAIAAGAATPVGIGAISFGVTQKMKDAGLTGEWLTLCSVLIGGICAYLSIFDPSLWAVVVPLLAPLTVSGGVSFVNGLTQ